MGEPSKVRSSWNRKLQSQRELPCREDSRLRYSDLFRAATGHAPYPYQERWAEALPEAAVIPTGLGKTEAAVLAWHYRRIHYAATPRRMIYVLPMRTLVDQTKKRIMAMNERLEHERFPLLPIPQIVMGGFVEDDWLKCPEAPSIVIGTQDMLLSRALNRGYAMSRYQWPMAFGALNDDCYWVIDEVQLQGAGARTASQLEGLRRSMKPYHSCLTTFMSATLDVQLITGPDFKPTEILTLSEDLAHSNVTQRLRAQKHLRRTTCLEPQVLRKQVLAEHQNGSLTLVILNTVKRAQEVYKALKPHMGDDLILLHSRFREAERNDLTRRLVERSPGSNLIAVATQVVEAGIDVDATTLFSDLAPWDSMVQRFGRCNRSGALKDARIFWMDPGEAPTAKTAMPYEPIDLLKAREIALSLEGGSASPEALPNAESGMRPIPTLRRVDLLDLFDTTTDMLGHDTDVSQYIRSDRDEFDVHVLWREEPPTSGDPPQRGELCRAPIGDIKKLIKRLREEKKSYYARTLDRFAASDRSDSKRPEEALWTNAHESDVHPGAILWLHASVGSYTPELGFFAASRQPVPEERKRRSVEAPVECDAIANDPLSSSREPITITQHGRETEEQARAITERIDIPAEYKSALITAALWHDVGKAHEVFQRTMYPGEPDPAVLRAKSDFRGRRHSRKYFRHEVASVLAFLQAHARSEEADLAAYLIAAHHGKARLNIQAAPTEARGRILGVESGDVLPEVDLGSGVVSPETRLDTSLFALASADGGLSWLQRATNLLDNLGPFRIAYLELLLRLADWRASALHQHSGAKS